MPPAILLTQIFQVAGQFFKLLFSIKKHYRNIRYRNAHFLFVFH